MRKTLFLGLLTAATISGAVLPAVTQGAEMRTDYAPGFPNLPATSEGWNALPRGRPFMPLISDPRDIKLGLRRNRGGDIEADVGGYKSFAGWRGAIAGEDSVVHLGMEGNAYFTMRQEGAKFPLQSSDGLIGLYAEGLRGEWLYQLRYTHVSAHLSDGLYGLRERSVYTRETLSLRLARQLGRTRVYAGYHFLAHTSPALPKHSLQLGFVSIFAPAWWRLHPYVGADVRLRGAREGNNLHVVGGLALVSAENVPPLRLALAYTKGHDYRGQFFTEKVDIWSLGLELDI